LGSVVLVGCISNEKDAGVQKKLAVYFEMSSNVNLDKNIRMKYIDSANSIIESNVKEDSSKIKNYFKVANRVFMMMEF
jgi:hypothetical protein